MTAAIAIIAQILPLLPTIGGDISALIKWISSIRTAAQQSGEWTPELEKAFIDNLILRATAPQWMTDAQLAAIKPS